MGIRYSPHLVVKGGAEFLIMEGPHIVGEGIVKDIEMDGLKGKNGKVDTNTDRKGIRILV